MHPTEPRAGPLGGPRPPSRNATRAAAALIALQLVLLVSAAWRVGPTIDEHQYLAAGYAYLETGDFARNREHPPLLKYLIALPVWLAGDAEMPEHWRDLVNYPVAFFYELNRAELDRNLFLARLGPCLLTALGSAGVFALARRWLGDAAGITALLLFAFDPNVIAHGSLATLDGGVAVLFFLAVAAFVALLERPSPPRALAAGLLFGLANLAKFTALLLVPVELALAAIACLRARSLRPLGWTAMAFLAGLGVFAAGYGFEARSVDAAWAEPLYVEDTGPRRPASTPAELAASAKAAGLGGASEAIASETTSLAAVDRLADELAAGGATAQAALAALQGLAGAPSDERKLAAARILAARDRLDERRALEALAALTRARRSDLESYARWFEAARSENWDRAIFTRGWIARALRGIFGDERPIPLFSAWKGFDYQLRHGNKGHGTYYRGRILDERDFARGNPHPEYYLDVLAVKHPLTWLLAVGGGIAVWSLAPLRRGRAGPGWLRGAAALGTPLALLLVFSLGKTLMGVRYVLPALPFLALAGGALALRFPRGAPALAALAAVCGNWLHPHQLMFYGALAGGPARGPGITVVGDDWGQGLRAFGRFAARHAAVIEAAGGLHYEPYHEGDPTAFDLERARPVAGRPEGIVAVNALSYYRDVDTRSGERKYGWLDAYAPFAVIDRSISVYDTRGGPPGGDPLSEWEAEAARRARIDARPERE
jgi:4-amino-4-deoxy-L-arabinose transferase-like glycosyltransferase